MSQPGEQARRGEQRRGEELRRHILFAAKNVFLETGFERASMDAVAARAGTSKRSLYAHFENKEKLLLAVLDLVRELHLGNLRTPDAYAADPVEAVTVFCGRFLQLMVWEPQVQTCRLTITEAERLPSSARAYFDAVFTSTRDRLAAHLAGPCGLDPAKAPALAEDLLARAVLPRLLRTLLGIEEPVKDKPAGIVGGDDPALAEDVDLPAIRELVTGALRG